MLSSGRDVFNLELEMEKTRDFHPVLTAYKTETKHIRHQAISSFEFWWELFYASLVIPLLTFTCHCFWAYRLCKPWAGGWDLCMTVCHSGTFYGTQNTHSSHLRFTWILILGSLDLCFSMNIFFKVLQKGLRNKILLITDTEIHRLH